MAYLVKVTVRSSGQPGSSEHRSVAASRLTIGRGHNCNLPLNDVKRQVSREHAVVDVNGAGHVMTVVSKVNPVVLNGARVGPGESRPINSGDTIDIGDFSLQLLEASSPVAQSGSSRSASAGSSFDFGLGHSAQAEDDPFKALEALTAPKPKAPARTPAGADPFHRTADPSTGLVQGVGASPNLRNPGPANFDSSDPLYKLLNDGEPASQSSPTGNRPTFSPPSQGTSSIDHLLGPSGGVSSGRPLVDFNKDFSGGSSRIDHVQPINLPFKPPSVAADPASPSGSPAPSPGHDPFDGFDPLGSLLSPVPKGAPSFVAPSAPLGETQRMERSIPDHAEMDVPAAARAHTSSAARPAAGSVAPVSGLSAFLEGAGLSHLKVPEEDAEAFLRESGAIVRAAVEGLVGLLLARSEIKKELRAEDRTMIGSQDNNPLKLMTDPQEAISFLFDPKDRISSAFLEPVRAVEDACNDMRIHEIAMMAGMRAAFQGALKRFDPEAMEREFDKQKGLISLNKKVKLWDHFVSFHGKLSAEAEDDLLKVFGREFVGTYSAQVRRLRGK